MTEKLLEPLELISEPIKIFDSTWAQVAVLILVGYLSNVDRRLFPEKVVWQIGLMALRAFIARIGKWGDLTEQLRVFIGAVLVPVARSGLGFS